MKFESRTPPRSFTVGNDVRFEMKDCGTLSLEPDEQVTLTTKNGAEYDVARKAWGFYATPSLNGRLSSFGLRAVLVRNRMTGRYFVLLVEKGHEATFDAYLTQEHCEVTAWLDSTEALDRLRLACGAVADGEKSLTDKGNSDGP
jgi:hypothetical protein